MKQLPLALFISSLFVLSACEDKQALKETEMKNQIVQLESDYQKVQQELTQKERDLEQLKSELSKLSTDVPSLNVVIEPIFNKSQEIKFEKDPKDEYSRESSNVEVFVSIPKTNVQWLDALLLKTLFEKGTGKEQVLPNPLTEEHLIAQYQETFDSLVSEAKAEKPIGLSQTIDSYYIGQRKNIVSFHFTYNNYYGGAHGLYAGQYVHIDTHHKKVIHLDDLVEPKNQQRLKALLWESYTNTRSDPDNLFVKKEDFRISDSFYFSQDGVTFVYPPYELGAFAEGEIEVKLYWNEINPLINANYQQKAEDGIGYATEWR